MTFVAEGVVNRFGDTRPHVAFRVKNVEYGSTRLHLTANGSTMVYYTPGSASGPQGKWMAWAENGQVWFDYSEAPMPTVRTTYVLSVYTPHGEAIETRVLEVTT